MHNTKLIQYLSKFSLQELQQFRDFVDSPFFNKHEKTRQLLTLILKAKNWESAALQKEKIFKKLFPNKAYEEQLLSNVISYLLRLTRRFLAQQQFEKKAVEQQLNLLENAFQTGQKKLFELTAKRLQRHFSDDDLRDSNFYHQQHLFQRLLDDFNLNFGNRVSGEHLAEALDNFDAFFIGEKLKMTCQMLARRQVTGRDFSFSLMPELVAFLEKEKTKFQQIPSVWIYFLVYKMMTQSDPKFYFDLKANLKEKVSFFQHQEGRDLYTHAVNYCVRRINFGEEVFRKETFELYQQMLENGLLYVDEILPQWDYTNIVSLGCALQEFAWTKQFIFEQKEQLSKDEKENAFTYNLAAFYYSQQQFDSALESLRTVEFTDVYFDLLTRILTVKVYFETANWQALEYALETFRIYLLRNKKLTENRRKSGLNLLRFTKKIMRLKEEKSLYSKKQFAQEIAALKTQIEGKEMVMNKAWLLERV